MKASIVKKRAQKKCRVVIPRRRRSADFIVTGPDGKSVSMGTFKGALVNLDVRIRCWSGVEWKITAMPRRKK